MFLCDQPCIRWIHTLHGRSKRSEEVRTGLYVLEHVATGRLWLGCSAKVSVEVDGLMDALGRGEFPNKLLQSLCKSDLDLQVYEYPTSSMKAAQFLAGRIRPTVYPAYLLLN